MPYTVTAVRLLLHVVWLLPTIAGAELQRDSVEVLAISSEGSLEPGVPTVLDVRCRIRLNSMRTGVALFGVNARTVESIRMLNSVELTRAVTDTTVRLAVVPVDWGSAGKFYLLAAVGAPQVQGEAWTPTSRTRVELSLGTELYWRTGIPKSTTARTLTDSMSGQQLGTRPPLRVLKTSQHAREEARAHWRLERVPRFARATKRS